MITNSYSSLNKSLLPISNPTLFYYNINQDRKRTSTICSNEHADHEGKISGTDLNRKRRRTSTLCSNGNIDREGKTGGTALSSVSLSLRLKIYRERPQRIFEKIYAFNLSWLNRNTYASRALTQDIFDHLLIQWKDYEKSVTKQKKNLNKCKPVSSLETSSETSMCRQSTALTIILFIIFVFITAALFYMCNSRKIYFAQTMNEVPARHNQVPDSKYSELNLSVCEDICYPGE